MLAENIIPVNTLDEVDRQIIKATQDGLPLVEDPYGEIARRLGLRRNEIITRMQTLLMCGVIRRVGIIPNHYRLGFTANGMSVWNVPDNQVLLLGETIGQLDYVSHCYQRPRFLTDWPYNLFAMVHGSSRDEVIDKVDDIASKLGDDNRGHEILFSRRILKKTGLRI